MEAYAVKARRFVLPGGVMDGGYLPVRAGRFGFWQAGAPDLPVVECGDAWIAPGFVDTHIHGFAGHSSMGVTADELDEASRALARRGTTSWLPTTFTASFEDTGAACAVIAAADEGRDASFDGARIQGIYLEGPFFTMKHVGAQNPAHLADPSYGAFSAWQEKAGGRIVKSALAPERDGALAYIAALDVEGVVACVGHTDATYDQALAAVNAGARCFVHTYNGQRGLHHRDPGVVGAAMTTPSTYAELICDGRHVAPAAMKALVDAKGWRRTVPITDCLGCGGLPEGRYESGGLEVELRGGLCYLAGTDTIAGSVLTLAQGVKNMADWSIVTAEQAIRMATEVAARSAGIDGRCGSIKPGRAADFVVLAPDLSLRATYVGGRLVERDA